MLVNGLGRLHYGASKLGRKVRKADSIVPRRMRTSCLGRIVISSKDTDTTARHHPVV